MKGFEESCREASDYFKSLGDKSRDHKNRERMYKLSCDTFCAAVWIENMRKMEFFFAQEFPEEYRKVFRMVEHQDAVDAFLAEEQEWRAKHG